MPWTVSDTMTQRLRFILAYEQGHFNMTELCARFHISRKTGYKWIQRYQTGGTDALKDQARTPKTCPHRTPRYIEQRLIEIRRAHPRWGPLKIRQYLQARQPEQPWPAPSTIGDIIKRAGLVETRPRRRKTHPPETPPLAVTAPAQVWSADFKGQFRLGSGRYCYPLTVQDAYSRSLLACQGLPATSYPGAKRAFKRLFQEQGLPQALRTDNGAPFASQALGGLSRLNVWWIKLGIKHQRIRPASPQENGRHERMHRTLKAETARPPAATMASQQRRFDDFRAVFNTVRPHQALGGAVPDARYAPSPRPYPSRLPGPGYGGHMEVRRVSPGGQIRFKGAFVFVTQVLHGERVALEEEADGIWSVWFYEVLLGRLDERDYRLYPGAPLGRSATLAEA